MNISEGIKALRFPLAALVVYIHYAPALRVDLLTLTATELPVMSTLYTLFSHLIGSVAVPLFTAMSGYLYFIKIGKSFTLQQYKEQCKKRIHTLAIPYLGWIAITWVASIIYSTLVKHESWGYLMADTWTRLYYILWGGPLYFPFYYIRDLMVLTLLAPLWHWLIKRLSWGWIIASLLLYFAIGSLFTGLSTRLLFFFSLGAYIGIKGYRELRVSRPIGYLSIALSAVSTAIYLAQPIVSEWHERSLMLFIISFAVVVVYALQWLDFSHPKVVWWQKMGVYSFFIYATHQIYLIGFAKGFEQRLLSQLPAPLNDVVGIVTYITFPIAVIAILIVAYNVWAKVSPRTLAPLLGGRV